MVRCEPYCPMRMDTLLDAPRQPIERSGLDEVDEAKLGVLNRLAAADYSFASPAPSTQRRVLLRRGKVDATDLTDIFGWNLPFAAELIDSELFDLMRRGEMLRLDRRRWLSRFSVASIGRQLFLHTAFRFKETDAVFFGPDSLRFAAFIRAHIPKLPPQALIVDIGAGSGVGGLFAGALAPNAHVAMTDVNPMALRLARINAAFCGVSATLIAGEGLTGVTGSPALILANPPYIAGDGPTYSQGNGRFGEAMSLQWTREALARLASGGRLLLYTGSAIVRGRDRLKDALAALCDDADCDFSYRELDPDVFPGVLLKPRYWPVERIAAVGAVMVKRV